MVAVTLINLVMHVLVFSQETFLLTETIKNSEVELLIVQLNQNANDFLF